MKSVQKHLEALGMGEKEAKSYLASLALGPATAQEIAAKAAIERPTAYVAIGALTKRGLMSSFIKGKKKYFTAEDPEKLLKLVREEKKKLSEQEAKLKEVMPELEALISMSAEKPEVKFYEGLEGLESMRSRIFESESKTIDIVASVDRISQVVPEDSRILHNMKLKQAGIKGRFLIQTKGKISSPSAIFDNWSYRKSTTHTGIGGEIAIFKNYISLIAYQNQPYGVLIKSDEISNIARSLFEMAWKSAKPVNLRK